MNSSHSFAALAGIVVVAASAGGQDRTVGLIQGGPDASAGYTLFSPLSSTPTYLIDNDGNLVNSWTADTYPVGNSVYLLEDGSLLRCSDQGPAKGSVMIGGGDGSNVKRYDWNGELTWDFSYNTPQHRLHHDICPIPGSDNVLMIAWEYKSEAEAIEAGRNPADIAQGSLWPLHIIEVEPAGLTEGNIVWEWHVWDHLVQDFDPTADNYGVVADNPGKVDINFFRNGNADWIHANAIDYNPELDQIVISTPFLSEAWIINHDTTTEEAAGTAGDLMYRWGNPQAYDRGTAADQKLYFNHGVNFVPAGFPGEGNLIVFNNGNGRPEGAFSTVEEFTPPMNRDGTYVIKGSAAYGPEASEILYVADPPTSFYSSGLSGVQRLPNGNTLICKGRNSGASPIGGFFSEITPGGDEAWYYVNPSGPSGVLTQGDDPSGLQNVFACLRYAPDYSGFDGRDLTSQGPIELPACPGDLNGDGVVGGADLGLMLAVWGTADPAADLSGDGLIGGADIGLLAAAWGPCL